MQTPELEQHLDKIASQLAEHCDAVVILMSVMNADGSTTFIKKGRGNHFARIGMANEYVVENENYDAAQQIGRQLNS